MGPGESGAAVPSAAVPGAGRRSLLGAASLGTPLAWVEQFAEMIMLAGRTLARSVSPPYPWRVEFVDESWLILRRSLIPLALTTAGLGFAAPGLTAANAFNILGSVDRVGAFLVMASVREFAPYLSAMVVAAVGGTAICADLGARKIREEIDALEMIGLDPVRRLVVPRFLALGVVTVGLLMFGLVFGVIGGWFAAVVIHGETTAGYVALFSSNLSLPDLYASVLKGSAMGFIVAIICCYKGLTVRGGPEGVGRAVNQAVVLSFLAIWIFNYLYTSLLLAAFPETTVVR